MAEWTGSDDGFLAAAAAAAASDRRRGSDASVRLKADHSYKSLAAGGGAGGAVPLASVLPSLRELYEHSLAHTGALQRLMANVQDADKGKPAPMLSRWARCWRRGPPVGRRRGGCAGCATRRPAAAAVGPRAAQQPTRRPPRAQVRVEGRPVRGGQPLGL
jgi:hypothetical protein